MNESDRFRGCLVGLAVGDAIGTTVEFKARGTFAPLTDMVGGGPFDLKPGEWTDDTSMALCLATSLVEAGGFDAQDQMERYCRWYETGYLSCKGFCFDIGNTVRRALFAYKAKGDPMSGSTNPNSAGNGSLMRLAPVPMSFYPDQNKVIYYSGESSRTTHGALECVDACRLFGDMIRRAFYGEDKRSVLLSMDADILATASIQKIARGEYTNKTIDEIHGTGYVVSSLEAALWSFYTTTSFTDAILQAANLGDDADTTAAICGQLAGAFYGESAIPQAWLEKLAMYNKIRLLADRLHETNVA
jgi:ADP-ribosyl-[dinitrogen reductase] hydrolase